MKKLLALLIACLALALTFAACGGDDDDDGGGGSSATTEQTDTSAKTDKGAGGDESAAGGGSASVKIPEIAFEPSNLTVKAGTTVTWTNEDDLPHTVTKDGGAGADFDSGTLSPGDTFEQKFDSPGKVNYVCTIHPGQAGSITVK